MDANALDTGALLSNEVAQKTQCHIFDENWWVRTRLPEDTNPTACPWKDCWVWQWEREVRKVEGLGWVLSSWKHQGYAGSVWVSPCKGLAIQRHRNVSQGLLYQRHLAALPAQNKLCHVLQSSLSAENSSGCHQHPTEKCSGPEEQWVQHRREGGGAFPRGIPCQGSSWVLCCPALFGTSPQDVCWARCYSSVIAFSHSSEVTTLKIMALI